MDHKIKKVEAKKEEKSEAKKKLSTPQSRN